MEEEEEKKKTQPSLVGFPWLTYAGGESPWVKVKCRQGGRKQGVLSAEDGAEKSVSRERVVHRKLRMSSLFVAW